MDHRLLILANALWASLARTLARPQLELQQPCRGRFADRGRPTTGPLDVLRDRSVQAQLIVKDRGGLLVATAGGAAKAGANVKVIEDPMRWLVATPGVGQTNDAAAAIPFLARPQYGSVRTSSHVVRPAWHIVPGT